MDDRERQFCQYIKDHIREVLPEEYRNAEVELGTYVRGNDTSLTGIQARIPGEDVTPRLYLDPFLEEYGKGADREALLRQIGEKYAAAREDFGYGYAAGMLCDYEQCRDSLMVCLCGKERNQEALKELAHTGSGIDGLEAYYRVSLGMDASVPVTRSLLDIWGISAGQLHEDALRSGISRGIRLNYISDIVDSMEGRGFPYGMENIMETGRMRDMEEEFPMLVLTNPLESYGASAILQAQAMEQIGDMIGQNYYILPSSVHEVLLLPEEFIRDSGNAEELGQMIRDINNGVVNPEERLADEAYVYDRYAGEIVRAEAYEQGKAEIREALLGSRQGILAGTDAWGRKEDKISEKEEALLGQKDIRKEEEIRDPMDGRPGEGGLLKEVPPKENAMHEILKETAKHRPRQEARDSRKFER